MPSDKFTLRTIGPMFLNGANTREPDALRAPSVRGQLRYWFRALEGANKANIKELWELESRLFGSTGQGSRVSVRFYRNNKSGELLDRDVDMFPMLPHKSQDKDKSRQKAIREETSFELYIVARPGVNIPKRVLNTCVVWLLLGGLGKRSRRMFGAFNVDELPLKTPIELADLIRERISDQISTPVARPNLPDFPTLHPNHSRVLVGTRGQDDHEALVRDLFGLLRSDRFRNDERSFGYAMRGRRSSPLIAQARKIGNKYYPVLTAMRSKPDRDIRWDTVKDFMNEAQRRWACVEAWGEWR